MHQDLDRALQIYLGASATGGITPGGGPERFENAYGSSATALRAEVEACLESLNNPPPDWSRETYDGAIERVRALAKQRYPQLSDTTIKALANYFAYDWR